MRGQLLRTCYNKRTRSFCFGAQSALNNPSKRLLFYKICRFLWFFPSPLLGYLGSFVLDRHITDEERLAVSSGGMYNNENDSISRFGYLYYKFKANDSGSRDLGTDISRLGE